MNTTLSFAAGFLIGMAVYASLPDHSVHTTKAAEAVKLAYDMGRESVILEVIE